MPRIDSLDSGASAVVRPAPPPAPAPSALHATTGADIVDRHTRGTKTDIASVAQDLKHEMAQQPQQATALMKSALERLPVDDRDELAQAFVRAHSDDELKQLGGSTAGTGALALAVGELGKGSVYRDEAADARRIGEALGRPVELDVNAGWGRVSGWIHGALDVAGFIPGLGAIPDLVNAGIYAAEGDLKNAALSGVAAIPALGDGVKGASMAAKGGKALLEAGATQVIKHGDEVGDLAKAGLKASDEVADLAKGGAKSLDEAAGATKARGVHEPNLSVAHNGYTYRTDSLGRVSNVEGELKLNKAQGRNTTAQREAGGVDRRLDDQGGHYVGRRFDGPTDEINHFAQNGNFNMGAYKSLENQWAKALENGQQVRMRVIPHYDGSSLRPDKLEVRWSIDGKWSKQDFYNERGGLPPQG